MYNTSQNYKDKILNDSTQHELNIYIDGNKIEENHIIDFKITLELFNNDEFCLGSTPELDVEFEIDKRDLPDNYNEVYIESGLEDEIVPIGKFTIQSVEDDEFKVKIKATDYMKKFEDNKYDGSDLTYPATMLQVLQDICTKIGVELGSTSFLNSDKQISVYDNTVSARTYIGYIAEQAEGFAVVGRDGKLYIRTFGQNTAEFDINLFSDFSWGDKFKVSKVSYEDGAQNYKFGNNTGNTVYINQNNMYIVDSDQVAQIYSQIKDFEVYSFEGETIIDPAYDIGDILIIDGKKVLFQGELDYAGKFKASIKSKIQAKTEQESMQTKQTNSNKIKRVQSEINQIDGKITQLAQETTENTEKIAEHEVSIDEISNKVSNIADLTKTITDTKTITLDNCANGELLQLNIYGNNTVFAPLVLSDNLYLSDSLYLRDYESILIIKDEKGNDTNYDLKIKDTLRQNGNIKDEYILDGGKAKIIRRINQDGSIKDNEETEDLGELHIILEQGTNTIEIKDYNAEMKVKWAQKSDLTDTFATKVETNTKISQTSSQIMSEVDKKVDEEELGTKIIQDYESVQVAWNKISDFIKMMLFNNNASLCIVDSSNNVIASFDKVGEHFYKSGETTPFGEMGVQTVDDNQYISFSVEGEYDTDIYNGMAWGIKTKSDGKFYPIFYIKDFKMGAKNSDTGGGSLVLTGCNIVLNGIGTGIRTGGVDIYGDPGGSGLYFYDANDASKSYMQIFPENVLGESSVNILDKIQFGKNIGGTNSFLIGDQNGDHCLFSSDGHIYGKEIGLGNQIFIDSNGEVSGDITFYSLPSYQGDLLVYGEGHRYHLSWTGSQLQFWVDSTNVGTLSDKRLKKEIQDIDENFIKAIEEIEMKQFKVANRNGLISFGIMAQDLIEIFKKYNKNPFDYEIVFKTRYKTDDDTVYYAVNYEQFLILKQKANDIKFKKQQEIIEQLQEKIKEMEDKLNEIN